LKFDGIDTAPVLEPDKLGPVPMRADPEAGYFSKERTWPDPEPHKIQNQIYKNHTHFKQTQA
jgi:hypothetical protein